MLAACVARNGAWKGLPLSRMAFHQCAGANATSCVPLPLLSWGRCFSGSSNFFLFQSRGSCVSCPVGPTDIPVATDVCAANWRQHFASVGANPSPLITSSLEKSHRFHDIDSHPVVPSLIDAPFTPRQLRRVLSLCFDPVGIDGLLPWWQSAVLHFFNLTLSWWSSTQRAQHCGSCLQAWGPVPAHQVSLHVPGQWLLQNLGAPGPCNNRPPHFLPTLRMSRRFPLRCRHSFVGSLVDLPSSRSSSHTFVAFVNIHKPFDNSWVEGTLVRLFAPGV